MNYGVFEECGRAKGEQETDQAFMERIIKSSFALAGDTQKRINDKMDASVEKCSYEDKMLTLKFRVKDWMLNPDGTLHGGLLTTACDMTMGMLGRFYKESASCVTVQLNMAFFRSIDRGDEFTVEAHVEKLGRTLLFLSARVMDSVTGKPAGEAAAVFM